MKNKKNVDRLFQEQFKDFEMEPNKQVWKNIELALREKKNKKRIIPFWYKFSGIAAGLVIAFFLVYNSFENQKQLQNQLQKSPSISNGENNPIVKNDDIGSTKRIQSQKSISLSNEENNAIVNTDKVIIKKQSQSQKSISLSNEENNAIVKTDDVGLRKRIQSQSQKSNSISKQDNNAIVKNDDIGLRKRIQSQSQKLNTISISKEYNNKIVKTDDVGSNKQSQSQKSNTISISKQDNNAIVKTDAVGLRNKKQSQSQKSISILISKKDKINNTVVKSDKVDRKKQLPAQKSTNNSIQNVLDSQKETVIATNQKPNTTIKSDVLDKNISEKNTVTEVSKNNIEKIIEAKKVDSIAIASKTPNVLEELQQKKESEKKKIVPKTNKWLITSNVAPVFFNSSVKDSPIDPALNSYNKTFETNLSLGIGMGYSISKKLSIRTGLNKFVMSYATNEIFFRAGLGKPAAMQNMTNANNGAGLEIVSRSSVVDVASFTEISPQNISEGTISQRMGYFEVPLELSYAVLNKKFAIDLIGGFSTLFLTENEISMQSGAMTSTLGKANNLRAIHFSTNIGIGFRYQFWKSFQAKLEPTFKYQINTFTDNTVGFKPYFIGVYSGISFSF